VHLGRNVFGTDISIMARQLVSLQTKWTDPYLRSDVNSRKGIQNRSTRGLAGDRFVVQKRLIQFLKESQYYQGSRRSIILTLSGVSRQLRGTTSLLASWKKLTLSDTAWRDTDHAR